MLKGVVPGLFAFLLTASAVAQFPGPSSPSADAPDAEGKPPAPPPVKELDAERLQIGDVILNRKTREIRFPAQVNMAGGELLEFAIVHVNGKVHESLLSTSISPLHLNIALKLLRYQPSPELYPVLNEDGTPSGKFPAVSDEIKAASRLEVKVEWEDEGKTRTALINEWITDTTTGKSMPADPWVYGGSFTANGRYAAEATGDILAIYLSTTTMANFSGKDNDTDEVWLPFPKRVPPVGTKVTVSILPYSKTPPDKP